MMMSDIDIENQAFTTENYVSIVNICFAPKFLYKLVKITDKRGHYQPINSIFLATPAIVQTWGFKELYRKYVIIINLLYVRI